VASRLEPRARRRGARELGGESRDGVERWIAAWRPLAERAVAAFAPVSEQHGDAFATTTAAIDADHRSHLQACGLRY
jgi:hypothetical protein